MIDRERLAALAAEQPSARRIPSPMQHPTTGCATLRWYDSCASSRATSHSRNRPDPARLAAPGPQPQLTDRPLHLPVSAQGLNLLTDPVFSERCSPFTFAGLKRAVPAALTIDQLPPINVVLVSHNHYDHLDMALKQLQARFGKDILWFAPLGVASWLRKLGVERIIELGWWQSEFHGQVEAFCLPAQHFSGRGPGDHNRSLWCSWRLAFPDFSLYFAGDTGYAPLFGDIGDIFGPVDLALLPIGAYEPRWFMSPVHINPAEAVRIHKDIQAKQSVAMHWGTFVLTDEPMDAPPKALKLAMESHSIHPDQFRVPQHGETLILQQD